jgi:hypothetical protein
MKTRQLLGTFVASFVLGVALYALRPVPETCLGVRSCDGFRRDLFRGTLPPAKGVAQ